MDELKHFLRKGDMENTSDKFVWVFNAPSRPFSGGVFDNLSLAENWIAKYKLNGTLTKYPINQGTLDWAIENDLVGIKPEKLEAKKDDPDFIGCFTSASMEHYHYENGKKD